MCFLASICACYARSFGYALAVMCFERYPLWTLRPSYSGAQMQLGNAFLWLTWQSLSYCIPKNRFCEIPHPRVPLKFIRIFLLQVLPRFSSDIIPEEFIGISTEVFQLQGLGRQKFFHIFLVDYLGIFLSVALIDPPGSYFQLFHLGIICNVYLENFYAVSFGISW